jgi:polysaccharide biosynthesis protein PslF
VAGQTHPKVLLREGEAYGSRLIKQVHRDALTATVSIDGYYRHEQALAELVNSADVLLLPYDSTDQVTSGVLIEAVAALNRLSSPAFRTRWNSSARARACWLAGPVQGPGGDRRRATHAAHPP